MAVRDAEADEEEEEDEADETCGETEVADTRAACTRS